MNIISLELDNSQWIYEWSWKKTIASRRVNEYIKLELDNSNWMNVIESEDGRRF